MAARNDTMTAKQRVAKVKKAGGAKPFGAVDKAEGKRGMTFKNAVRNLTRNENRRVMKRVGAGLNRGSSR